LVVSESVPTQVREFELTAQGGAIPQPGRQAILARTAGALSPEEADELERIESHSGCLPAVGAVVPRLTTLAW
jgi:hypothetical protein